MSQPTQPFFAKDFIETADGHIFAVVASGLEEGKVLCFLRYALINKRWQKQSTESANALLRQYHPKYLHYSSVLDVELHAVAIADIHKHHQPMQRLQALLLNKPNDAVEQDLQTLCQLLNAKGLDLNKLGITGSVLVGLQNASSDLDLICYGREVFQQCRAIVRELVQLNQLYNLTDQDWQESYQRRSSALSYQEYVWHELRKFNKGIVNSRKFDLNFIDASAQPQTPMHYQKQGAVKLLCRVVDDSRGFDYPAEFVVDAPDIDVVLSFTATYTGQAFNGELIEVVGQLEVSDQGQKRIVVGVTREAAGEHIKVVHE